MTFSADISKFIKKANKNTEIVFRLTALEMFSDIVEGSIVGDPSLWISRAPKGYTGGSYRANWQTSINAAASGEISGTDKQAAIASINAGVNRVKIGQRIYLTNNLPYAQGIENGTASQRGTGKVKLSVSKFDQLVKAFTKKVNP